VRVCIKQERITGAEYDAFVNEFMEAAIDAYGRSVMLQVNTHTQYTILHSNTVCFMRRQSGLYYLCIAMFAVGSSSVVSEKHSVTAWLVVLLYLRTEHS
jgi:hypothetical protein